MKSPSVSGCSNNLERPWREDWDMHDWQLLLLRQVDDTEHSCRERERERWDRNDFRFKRMIKKNAWEKAVLFCSHDNFFSDESLHKIMWTGKSRDITIKEIGFCNSRNELFQMFTELDRASQPRKVHVKIPKLRLHHTRSRNRNQTQSQASLIRPEPDWSNLLRTWLNSDVKSEHTDRQRQHQSSAPKTVKRRALISIRIGIT